MSTVREDMQEFMERIVRDYAVAPLDPVSPGLLPQERRSWWEFCLWMDEFLRGVIRDSLVSPYQAQQLSRLRWILMKGSYVFGMSEPALRGEQRRFVELCVIISTAFAVIVDDPQGIQDAFEYAFGPDRFWRNGDPKEPAEAEALMENWLSSWRNWEHNFSPIGWIEKGASKIHERDHTLGGYIRESDAMYSTPKKRRDHSDPSLETARDVLPLEEVGEGDLAGVAHQALPRRTWMSVRELIAAVQDDEDLRVYTELRVKGYKPRTAWEHLGWETKRGQAVDRRYRRLREKLKASGFEHQSREIELTPGLSDASCTVVKERLRIPVHPGSEGTLSGRVVYDPRVGGERFGRSN